MALIGSVFAYEIEIEYKDYRFPAIKIIKSGEFDEYGRLEEFLTEEEGWTIEFDEKLSSQDKLIVERFLISELNDLEVETVKIPECDTKTIIDICCFDKWKKHLICKAVDHNFISKENIEKAADILNSKNYKDVEDFFNINKNSSDDFILSLVRAIKGKL